VSVGYVVVARPLPFLDPLAFERQGWPVQVLAGDGASAESELLRAARQAVALVVAGERVDAPLFAAAPRLRVVSQFGVGVDNIDLQAAAAAGVTVTNLPDLVTDSTAELTIALMLACARRIPECDRSLRSRGSFPSGPDPFLSPGLHGRRLGIVGIGRIGTRVARIAVALGMTVHYWARPHRPDLASAIPAERHPNLMSLCRASDVLTVHVPSTSETRGMIGDAEIGELRPGSIVINTARGGIVDEGALIASLRRDHLAAVGLDVYEDEPQVRSELREDPRTVLTPHIGTSTIGTRRAMVAAITQEVLDVLAGNPPQRPVSLRGPSETGQDG
jgi:glyoxylate reductase